eukprot:scaffold2726_cov167-Amphora_coffeaeformis.AAC.7
MMMHAYLVMLSLAAPLPGVFSFTPSLRERQSCCASVVRSTTTDVEHILFLGIQAETALAAKLPTDLGRRRAVFQVAAMLSSAPALSVSAAGFEKVTQLTEQEAEKRLREGRKSIQYLLDHFDEIAAGGGDNVRRYLGTVGFTSGLVQIDKTMKALEDRADDFVEFTETRNEVAQSIQQADGSAYMAIFVTTSPSETPPEKYFNDSKIEVKNCIKAMDRLAELIDLKY